MLRSIVLKADKDIVEDWKWGPNYSKKGMICGIGAFKQHVTLTFFQGAAMKDPGKILAPCSADNAHNRSIKFRTVGEIDAKILTAYVKEAVALNEKGVRAPARRVELAAPTDLLQALSKDKKARAYFESLAPGYRRDYVDWVLQAKQPETRLKRIETTVQQCAESKTRNWKYATC